jgi:hypothetical protein
VTQGKFLVGELGAKNRAGRGGVQLGQGPLDTKNRAKRRRGGEFVSKAPTLLDRPEVSNPVVILSLGQGVGPATAPLAVIKDSPVGSAGVFHSGEGQPLARGLLSLVSGQRKFLSTKEQEESDRVRDEVTTWCQWDFELGEHGFWLCPEPRVLTWKRLRVQPPQLAEGAPSGACSARVSVSAGVY